MLCIVKKTIETIKETGNEVIVQVKSNQKKLLNETKIFAEESNLEIKYIQQTKQAHGRREKRKVEVFKIPEYLGNNLDRWKHIKCIVKVTRLRNKYNTKKKNWEPAKEESYYLSTIILKAIDFCRTIQNHWKIENVNHNVKDGSFKEDSSRIRKNPMNFAILRSFVLNILRINNVSNVSDERFLNCCNIERIFRYNCLT